MRLMVRKDTKSPVAIGQMVYIDTMQLFGRVIHKTYSGHQGLYLVDIQTIDDGSIIEYVNENLIARVIFEYPEMKLILRPVK